MTISFGGCRLNAIETIALTKDFNGLKAVDGLNLEIKEGELFGLLGPNGAGKTTTLKMLSTLINPSSGKASVAGFDINLEKDLVRESIGMVFQDISLDIELTGRENLDFHARMYGMEKDLRRNRIDEVLDLVALEDKRDIFVKYYSGGMQRRLEIARGLMHYPKVLFLDEPTLGLDAQTRRVIWDYIKELSKNENITIILTTHYMEEADFLCDRVGIMDFGRIVALGNPDELKDKVGEDRISLEIKNPTKETEEIFNALEWVMDADLHDGSLELNVKSAEKRIPAVIDVSNQNNIEITSVSLRKPTLEDVFLNYTGRTIREAESAPRDRSKQNMRIRRRLWTGRSK
jgi:ABC-2 type transport system ATP-binding protein